MGISVGTIVRPYQSHEADNYDLMGNFPCRSVNSDHPGVCVGIIRKLRDSGEPDNPYVKVDWLQQCEFHKRELIPERDSLHMLNHLWEIGYVG